MRWLNSERDNSCSMSSLTDQLIRDEAVRLKPYRDSVGKLTIGIGRNLDDKGISLDEAKVLLSDDIAEVTQQLADHLPWTTELDEPRRGVLLNMAFNLGTIGLLGFHNTLTLISEGHYDEAATAMLESRWASQVGARATRLAEQMRTGQWV